MSAPDRINHLQDLSWTQIDTLPRERTLILIPISPLEEHGPHLPVGTDFLTASKATQDAMKDITDERPDIYCAMYPPIPLGYAKASACFPGTIVTHTRTVKSIITDTINSLAKYDFCYFLICTYHMDLGHLKAIYKGINKAKRQNHNIRISEPWAPYFHSNTASELEPDPGFDTEKEVHADFRETSLMLHIRPDLVQPTYKDFDTNWADLYTPKALYKNFKELGLTNGYVGTPKKANKEYGRWFYNETVNAYKKAGIDILDGKPTPDLPKDKKRMMKALFWL